MRGKTIATYGIGAPPQVAFQVTLAKNGIDPETDVTWKPVPFDLVGETVDRGEADLAAHLDPWAYSIEKKFNFTKIADTQTGIYEGTTCCVLGANGPFLEANRDALRRLAEANIEIHEYVASHPGEVAKWYLVALNPAGLRPGRPRGDHRRTGHAQPPDRAGTGRPVQRASEVRGSSRSLTRPPIRRPSPSGSRSTCSPEALL
ncbi:hypothetical protein X743_30340 [Mesorhizobium sp. LNHC252B00]|uniref:ABC transporter substrate-binding protein n=1 Tax=Mesorhizobium sp. LNHC252B00 TaxID=1287252 RepID=UPI0003CF4532|nr:ABC transporter substrate-binding protein [Mesorhizobium sp. LNHC252B00]ESY64961.1 hypothetical protein X743_30340 [Mesorhizobium sp. LNHC252B00]